VGFHGLDAQAQAIGYFPGRLAAHDQSQDLQLAPGQVVIDRSFGRQVALDLGQGLVDHRMGDGRAQVALVAAQGIEGLGQFGGGGVLEQVAVGADFQGLHDQLRVGVHRQDQHLALRANALESLQRFTHWMGSIADRVEREPVAAVRDLIHGVDYESWLFETSPSPKAAEMRMKNVNQLFSWMTEMLEGTDLDEPMTLTQVVTRFTLRDMMERGESDEELDQVQLMTLHASKGLEFPYVFLVGMEEGLLPHQSSIDEDNVDEERRLAYVGITRAQKELFFTQCRERRQYGELIRPEPSRFLMELPQDDLEWETERKVVSPQERMVKGQSHLEKIREQLAKAKK